MTKDQAVLLQKKIDTTIRFSNNPDRSKNFGKETFKQESVSVLSSDVAVVTYLKSTGKRAIAVFVWVSSSTPYWQYLFPTDSHILGLQLLGQYKQKVEDLNYQYNFRKAANDKQAG
jgi:hypothetical protein